MEVHPIFSKTLATISGDLMREKEEQIQRDYILRLEKQNMQMLNRLRFAEDTLVSWKNYIPMYFQRKLDLNGDIAKITETIAAVEQDK